MMSRRRRNVLHSQRAARFEKEQRESKMTERILVAVDDFLAQQTLIGPERGEELRRIVYGDLQVR